jgi:hypothetical protein
MLLRKFEENVALVLVEPGSPHEAAQALCGSGPTDQAHVLLLARDEPVARFRDRVRQRTASIRRAQQRLSQVTYVVGPGAEGPAWEERGDLLNELCRELEANGRLELFAPSAESCDALGCVGELQASARAGLTLRAVFDPPVATPAPPSTDHDLEPEERSGVHFARPTRPTRRTHSLRAVGA